MLAIKNLVLSLIALFERIPPAVARLGLRAGVFVTFWNSGTVKLDDWQGTIGLFAEEYQVPLLPPELAAILGRSVEVGAAGLGDAFRGARLARFGRRHPVHRLPGVLGAASALGRHAAGPGRPWRR
mgnify:CR=1 FL=1